MIRKPESHFSAKRWLMVALRDPKTGKPLFGEALYIRQKAGGPAFRTSLGARHAPVKERNDGTAASSLGYTELGIWRTGRSHSTVAPSALNGT
ncbi:hypothetical protein [Rhizomicrobium electricum]|uniref:hypothetical protein n=1 Tax=Rhizomicrobium electricum TaxID=480070 RepID=UPI0031D5354E